MVKKEITYDDPVYSGRNFKRLWDYVVIYGSDLDTFFNGINYSRERILDKNEWFNIDTTVKIWKNYKKCLPDFDMTEASLISQKTVHDASFGINRLLGQFSSIKFLIKLIPKIVKSLSRIDQLKILDLKESSAVIEYRPVQGFEKFIDSSHVFFFSGFFSALPSIHNMPLASVCEKASIIDVFKKFRIDFAEFCHTIEEKDDIIFLDGQRAGRWINISEEHGLTPCINQYLSDERCILWERDIRGKKSSGKEIVIAEKGNLYNCSRSIFTISWENAPFSSRIKNALPAFGHYLYSFFKNRDELFMQTSRMHDQANMLQKRVKEKTRELKKIHEEIAALEKRTAEHQITGGFAHEIRNCLAGAQLELKSLTHREGENQNSESINPTLMENHISSFLTDLTAVEEAFHIPKNKTASYFTRHLMKMQKRGKHLSDTLSDVAESIDTSLAVTGKTREYSEMYELAPGSDSVDIAAMLNMYQLKFKNRFKKYNIQYGIQGVQHIEIKASRDHFITIFSHLLQNAMDAVIKDCSEKQPKIEVTVESAEKNHKISVRDNGTGIKKEDEKKIFDPFFTTRPEVRTGLGLCVVQRLVLLYGGRIGVKSRMGRGSTFEIILPQDNQDQKNQDQKNQDQNNQDQDDDH